MIDKNKELYELIADLKIMEIELTLHPWNWGLRDQIKELEALVEEKISEEGLDV